MEAPVQRCILWNVISILNRIFPTSNLFPTQTLPLLQETGVLTSYCFSDTHKGEGAKHSGYLVLFYGTTADGFEYSPKSGDWFVLWRRAGCCHPDLGVAEENKSGGITLYKSKFPGCVEKAQPLSVSPQLLFTVRRSLLVLGQQLRDEERLLPSPFTPEGIEKLLLSSSFRGSCGFNLLCGSCGYVWVCYGEQRGVGRADL